MMLSRSTARPSSTTQEHQADEAQREHDGRERRPDRDPDPEPESELPARLVDELARGVDDDGQHDQRDDGADPALRHRAGGDHGKRVGHRPHDAQATP